MQERKDGTFGEIMQYKELLEKLLSDKTEMLMNGVQQIETIPQIEN